MRAILRDARSYLEQLGTAFEIDQSLEEFGSYRDSKKTGLANRFMKAYRDGVRNEMVLLKNEDREWNREMVLRGKPEIRVDLGKAVKSRSKSHQSPRSG